MAFLWNEGCFDPVFGIFNRVISPRDEVLCGLELLKPKIMIDFSQTDALLILTEKNCQFNPRETSYVF